MSQTQTEWSWDTMKDNTLVLRIRLCPDLTNRSWNGAWLLKESILKERKTTDRQLLCSPMALLALIKTSPTLRRVSRERSLLGELTVAPVWYSPSSLCRICSGKESVNTANPETEKRNNSLEKKKRLNVWQILFKTGWIKTTTGCLPEH